MISLHEDDYQKIKGKTWIKGKTRRVDTHQNLKKHMPLLSLSLRHKMVVIQCVVYQLTL